MKTLIPELNTAVQKALSTKPAQERLEILAPLIHYLKEKLRAKEAIALSFICTHNSRRSQFSQVWAQALAHHFQIPLKTYSGGVEETAFNPRAIRTLRQQGFLIDQEGEDNPHYRIRYGSYGESLTAFSKIYDHPLNPDENFAAIMTCSDADENCPFIPGADERISLLYEDPKAFDDTNMESEKYLERSEQIASELAYVFAQVK